MRIMTDVYQCILNAIPAVPPEIGGILGGVNGVVCKCQIDTGNPKDCGCFYSPNVNRLNATIQAWQKTEVRFIGMFHTHFFGVSTLSDGDIAYIKTIMAAMPEFISKLYFPIVVMPEKVIVVYLAWRNGMTVEIKSDELIIV